MGKPTHHLDATPPPETACSAAQADSLSGTSAQQENIKTIYQETDLSSKILLRQYTRHWVRALLSVP